VGGATVLPQATRRTTAFSGDRGGQRVGKARCDIRIHGGSGDREPVSQHAERLVDEQFQVGVGAEFTAGAGAVEDAGEGRAGARG